MPKLFKVGGCVRDKILGTESKDIDFTFVLDDLNQSVEQGFKQMEDWMSKQGFQIFLSTPTMFTIRAKFPENSKHKGLCADFVMARKEVGYVEGTRNPILELGSLEDDLSRRDFTLNALAEDEFGKIIDLFQGQIDLSKGILRTPLDAKITMMDDPLRILRALRFSITKGFTIHHTVWDAMKQPFILDKLEKTVSRERMSDEILKMMQFDTVKTMRTLHTVDSQIIPGFLDLVFQKGLWLKPTFKKC